MHALLTRSFLVTGQLSPLQRGPFLLPPPPGRRSGRLRSHRVLGTGVSSHDCARPSVSVGGDCCENAARSHPCPGRVRTGGLRLPTAAAKSARLSLRDQRALPAPQAPRGPARSRCRRPTSAGRKTWCAGARRGEAEGGTEARGSVAAAPRSGQDARTRPDLVGSRPAPSRPFRRARPGWGGGGRIRAGPGRGGAGRRGEPGEG